MSTIVSLKHVKKSFSHQPVLLHEAVEALHIRENGIYVDGTAGGG